MNAGSDCIVLAHEVWHPHLHLQDWSSSLTAEGSGLYGYDVLWTIWCSLVGPSRTLTMLRWKNTLWNEYFVLCIIVEEDKVFCFVNSLVIAFVHTSTPFVSPLEASSRINMFVTITPHLVFIVADPIRNQVLHEYHTRLWILYKIIVSCIFAWTTNKKFWTHQF